MAGKGQADQELQKFYSDVLPPDMSGARRITFLRIEQLATAVRACGSSARPRVHSRSATATVKFIYAAALSGEYRNIRRFIHDLETAPEFLVLENVAADAERGENRGD